MLLKYFGVCWNGKEPGKRKSAKIIKKIADQNLVRSTLSRIVMDLFFSDPGPDNLEIRFAQTQIILISNKMKRINLLF